MPVLKLSSLQAGSVWVYCLSSNDLKNLHGLKNIQGSEILHHKLFDYNLATENFVSGSSEKLCPTPKVHMEHDDAKDATTPARLPYFKASQHFTIPLVNNSLSAV